MSRAAWRRAVVGALLLATGGGLARAQMVRAVAVTNTGPGRVDEAFVLGHCTVKPDQTLERAAVSRDVRSLLDSGHFADVRAEVEPLANGVRVLYAVRAKLKMIEPLAVQGARQVSAGKIRTLIGLKPGDFVDDPTIAARVVKVREHYRKKRYSAADIRWTIAVVDADAGLARVTVTVDEGAPAVVDRFAFTGNAHVGAETLRQAMGRPAWYNPVGWFRKSRFDREELQAGGDRIRRLYQERGYLDVRVGDPQVTEPQPGRYGVTVPVTEGARYRFGALAFQGVTLFPEPELRRLARWKPGDVASVVLLEQVSQAVRDYYESRGYMGSTATPALDLRGEQGVVDVRFAVVEGPLTYIRNVVIRGNEITRDRVIRRELLVMPGEKYDGVRARTSEVRLRNLGYFASVVSYPEPAAVSNECDLVFEVEEQRTGQFMIGAGFSSVDEWVGFVEITQGNFDITRWPPLGGGQKFRFRAQYGEKVHDYALSFVEPWFLNRQLALGFDLYDQWREEDEYDLERLGAATSLGVGLGGANRLNLRYRLEKVRLSSEEGEPYVDVEDNVFTYDEPKRVVSALTATLSRDTRDSVFVPTRGHRLYFTGTVMGGPLGFDTDLYNLEAGAAFHVPLWFRHVLSLRGRAEVVDVFGDTERVPLSERLFAGGPYTIRGFKYRWVGPRAKPAATPEGTPDSEVDWRPGGGQTLGVATVEYTVPVVTGIRLAGFYDTGNVWYDAFEFDLRHLAAGAGVGIRFDIPGFPMRIDYAWPVSRDDGWPGRAKHENWSFSIGYGF